MREERVLFGPHAEKSWTGRSQYDQLRDLTTAWTSVPEEAPRLAGLWTYQRKLQRMNNMLLHHTPIGLDAFYD